MNHFLTMLIFTLALIGAVVIVAFVFLIARDGITTYPSGVFLCWRDTGTTVLVLNEGE